MRNVFSAFISSFALGVAAWGAVSHKAEPATIGMFVFLGVLMGIVTLINVMYEIAISKKN